ncbi:MAG: hypothetical protein ABL897_02820 [Hyphomicrobium sp.]
MRAVLAVAFAAVALAGCESSSNILAGGDSTAPQTAIAPLPPANGALAKLEIAPVIGAPENISRDLQTQLTSSMERNRISVARAPGGKGEYTLRGYIVAAREKTGSKISYIWDVTDQSGKRANRITGEEFAAGAGKDPWSSVSPQIVQSIADKTAAQIASWLPGGTSAGVPVANAAPAMTAPSPNQNVASAATPAVSNGTLPPATPAALTTAASTPVAPAGPTTGSIDSAAAVATMVPAVTGAPGDGSATLTTAIQRELTKNGVSLTSTAGTQTYKVEGKVAMGQGKDGKQPIQIDWNVIDPKGKKLGTVSQKNEVPQGSLDGAWGKTADAAAAAAAQGILKLLPQQKATN